jgi:hypothetical protein
MKAWLIVTILLPLWAPYLWAETSPFLDQTKEVSPQLEWNREIVTRRGGKVTFMIESQGPVSIIVLSGKGYQALLVKDMDAIERSDLILNLPSVPTPYKRTVTAPPGSSYFIIQNLSDKTAKMRLRCYDD